MRVVSEDKQRLVREQRSGMKADIEVRMAEDFDLDVKM